MLSPNPGARNGALPDRTSNVKLEGACTSYPNNSRPSRPSRNWPRYIRFDGELIDTHRSITSLGWRLSLHAEKEADHA